MTCALHQVIQGRGGWAYAEAGSVCVCAGMPASEGGPEKALRELLLWAEAREQALLLFGVELADLPWLSLWTTRELGRQPIFVAGPQHEPTLAGNGQPERGRQMRRQARRALSKGVCWKESSAAQVWELHERGELTPLLRTRWLRQPLPELSFLVGLHLAAGHSLRRFFLLWDQTQIQPLGLAILVQSRRGWLLEHQIVGADAPNGSGELLIAQLLARELAPGVLLSLGITPLYRALVADLPYQEMPALLSFVPRAVRTALVSSWEPMYGFRRLARFRAKLEPDHWEPVYWAQHGVGTASSLLAVFRVFAGGSLRAFAGMTACKRLAKFSLRLSQHGLQLINRFFLISLCCWIPVLWHLDGEILYGTVVATKMWAIYDLGLVLGFALHGHLLKQAHPQVRQVSAVMLGLVAADACLSSVWTFLLHQTGAQNLWLTLFLLLLAAAPFAASVYLVLCLVTPSNFLRHGGSRRRT